MKKTISAIVAVVFSASLLLGTTGISAAAGARDPVKVKFFTGKVETVDLMNELIKEFNEKNPGIVVEQEFQKDASNAIKVKFASGDIPDITTVVSQDYIDQGKYMDLSGQTQWWSRVQPSIKAMCTDVKTKKQFKIASNMTMAGLFYNKDIFKKLNLKPATTWTQFVSNLTAIKTKMPEVVPMFVGGKEPWMLGHLIEFMPHGYIKQKYGATGAKVAFLNNDDGKLQFGKASGPMDMFAKRFLELKNKKLFNSDFLTATYDNQLDAFANGDTAIISQGMWALSGILEKNPDIQSKIGFMQYPPIVDSSKPTILSAEDSVYAITAASTHKEEAKKFLDFLFSKENLKKYSESIKSPCSFTDVNADWSVLKDEVNKALKNGVNIGFTNENPSGFSGDDAGRMVQDLYAGKYKTSLDFAKAYKAAWDKAYKAGKN